MAATFPEQLNKSLGAPGWQMGSNDIELLRTQFEPQQLLSGACLLGAARQKI